VVLPRGHISTKKTRKKKVTGPKGGKRRVHMLGKVGKNERLENWTKKTGSKESKELIL